MLIKTRKDDWLIVWNLILIIIFGIWWELQLWVPIFLMIFVKKYIEVDVQEKETKVEYKE